MSNKYLIIEQVKFNNFNDLWSVKYFDQMLMTTHFQN